MIGPIQPKAHPLCRVCVVRGVKLGRHTERPAVAAVTLADILHNETLIIVFGVILIAALLVQVAVDIEEWL
jgi:hypothetical protein